MTLTEGSLHKWFKGSKSKDGIKGWVNVVTGGTCASDKPGEGTPKCVSSSKRASMTKAERLSASRRKKKADPNQQSKSGAAKPTYVRTDSKKKMNEDKVLKTIAKELVGASKMHKGQSEKIKKHLKDMRKEEVKLETKKNCGCGQDPCVTYGKKELTQAQKVDEACWKGYTQKGMKKKGKRVVPNCVKEGEGYQPEIEHSKLGDAKKKADKKRESKLPPHLQGDAIGKMKKAFSEEDKKGKGSGSKDACYHKVKASAKVWPSAYASGRLVQCRKKGAANYGKSKSEEFEYETWTTDAILEKVAAWQRKEGKNPEGGLNQKGVDSYRRDNPGSKLKTAVTTKPSKLKKGSKSANRRKSFCARMSGMKKKLTSAKTANDPDSRINKSLRKWNCSYEPEGTPIMEKDRALDFVRKSIEKKHGKGAIYDPKKVKKPSEADKAKAAAERKKDPSQGRYPKG